LSLTWADVLVYVGGFVRERFEPMIAAQRIEHGIDSNPCNVDIVVIEISPLKVIDRFRFVAQSGVN